jgi:hypothetical protein
MSLSPSLPPGAPSLTEVLVERTFAKPPSPFVDGEFLEALERADDAPVTAPAAGGAGTASAGSEHGPGGGGGSPGEAPAAAPAPAPQVDVRV